MQMWIVYSYFDVTIIIIIIMGCELDIDIKFGKIQVLYDI